MDELTQKIPINSYLSRIKIDNTGIELSGLSENANALVPVLNESTTWYEPKIVGNVMPDPRSGKERFTIQAGLQSTSESLAGENGASDDA